MTIKVFISFDWHKDAAYRNLLTAFNKNPANDIEFEDSTPGAIDSNDVGRVKGVLTTKIRSATHALILIGEDVNTRHADAGAIGDRNWQWWEINKCKEENLKFIAVKLDANCATPEPLLGAGAKFVAYGVETIQRALREA